MRDSEATRKWQRLPEHILTHEKLKVNCELCGKPVTVHDDYQAVKRKNSTAYYHTSCIKEAQNNG